MLAAYSFAVHQLEKPELALLVVEKQVDIRFVGCLSPRCRAEQIQTFDAEPFKSASCCCNLLIASSRFMPPL